MRSEPVQDSGEVVALLCAGDSAEGSNIILSPVFGRPFIHHLVKRLEALGIERFFIGIDSIPGSLLSYGDQAKREGLDVQFVRNPGEMAATLPPNALILVQKADIVWDDALIKNALAEGKPLVAAVEERAENQPFERIDLNHRWGGLAILPRSSVEPLTSLPDGWDMGSSLLRRALQDEVPLWQVRQADLHMGAVQPISAAADLKQLAAIAGRVSTSRTNCLEKYVIEPLIERLLPSSWASSWLRDSVDWGLPVAVLAALTLAWFGISISGTVAGLVGIFLAGWRKRVRQAEYRSEERDWIGKSAWALLALALGISLYNDYETATEAAFLTLAFAGVAVASRATRFWLASPLTTALALLWGQVAGLAGPTIRLLIVAQLALLVASMRKSALQANQT